MTLFKNIQIGQLFRVLGEEYVGQRLVPNKGLYLKAGHNVSVDISNNANTDCVFDMDTQCRIIETKARIDYASYEAYKICAIGAR